MEHIQSVVTTYMHDYKTGVPRGQTGSMLYMTEQNTDAGADDPRDNHSADDKTNGQKENTEDRTNKSYEQHLWESYLNAVGKSKGKGKDGKDKSKGYGKCWHCGEWGHPRIECPGYLKLQSRGDVSALKGIGRKGYTGKGKQGKGKGGWYGNGKGGYYRSPGKGMGQGLNYWGG